MTCRLDHRCPEQGFTLLELVVTLGLLALIVSAIVAGLGTGRRVWQVRGNIEAASSLGAVRSMIEARLADAMPLSVATAKGIIAPGFEGAETRLDFIAPSVRLGLARQTLRLVNNGRSGGAGLDLVLEEGPLVPSRLGEARPQPTSRTVLVDGVEQLAYRYLGAAAAGDPGWTSTWHGRTVLPRLVGLSLTLPRGDRRRWPELIVELPAAAVR